MTKVRIKVFWSTLITSAYRVVVVVLEGALSLVGLSEISLVLRLTLIFSTVVCVDVSTLLIVLVISSWLSVVRVL